MGSESKNNLLTGKRGLTTVVLLGGVLGLLASVQSWVHLKLLPGVATVESLSVAGKDISPSLTLVSLAALAAGLVLMIAGKGFRRVIAVLIVILGVGLSFTGVTVQVDALAGASASIEEVSGIAGSAQATLIDDITVTVWPIVTVVIGAVLALSGILVLAFGGRWKTGGRKYESSGENKRKREAGTATGDRISDWEALSDGDDPTDDSESEEPIFGEDSADSEKPGA